MRAKPIGVLMLALAIPAVALAAEETAPAQREPQAEKCKVQPEPESKDPAENGKAGDGESLTGKLDPCNGVLKPPATGDTGMTKPAPNQGKTPVIKPGEIPAQPPKQ